MKLILTYLLLALPFFTFAQGLPLSTKKTLVNPLVLGNIPKKALSLQYEYQTNFNNTYTLPPVGTTFSNAFSNVQGLRLNFNQTLVAKPKTYISLDAGYWYSKFNSSANSGVFVTDLNNTSLHSFTAATSIFKPLNARNFILINASVELNGNNASFKNIGLKNIFAGGALIYGWKKGFSSMTGLGILRAYRLGRVVHIPAFLMNRDFNKKWGVEMLLPARANFRYRPNKKNILMAGFDLEGAQYAYGSTNNTLNNTFFQRGEIKPKIGWETEISKNMRFTLNTGTRINARMDLAKSYDGKQLVIENNPKANLFVNVGFSIVSFKSKK